METSIIDFLIPESYGVFCMVQTPLSVLRHELRTHLNIIVGYSDLLSEEMDSAKAPCCKAEIDTILQGALELKDHIAEELVKTPEEIRRQGIEETKLSFYSPLYTIIASAQDSKEKARELGAEQALRDLETVLKATGNILEILDRFFDRLLLDELAETSAGTGEMTACEDGEPGEAGDQEGTILVIDDDEMNRDLLGRHLGRQGYRVISASSGTEGFSLLRDNQCDLIILDIMMPDINGFKVLELLKMDKILRHIPVIIMSALDDMKSIIHCIEIGAEDYLPKSFNPVLLKARVRACIEKKRLRDKEQQYVRALMESQKRLDEELNEAARYVRSLLPSPMEGPVRSRWAFIPSARLGGDSFGYQWLDDDTLALYLMDVSGHGIGAALLSVSVMNTLNARGFQNTDYADPADVLRTLNNSFQMERQNDMYFTIWYGVYHLRERTLRFSNGGAPPAVLMEFREGGGTAVSVLDSEGAAIGIAEETGFFPACVNIPEKARLYLFSDGIFDIRRKSGKVFGRGEFVNLLSMIPDPQEQTVDFILKEIMGISGSERFDDDVSLLEFRFP